MKCIRMTRFGVKALCEKCWNGGIDHFHRTANVHLMAAQVGMIGQHGLMHQTGTTSPLWRMGGIGQHRNHSEIGMLVCPALGQIEHVQVACIAHAPIQLHLALHSWEELPFGNGCVSTCKSRWSPYP